MTTPGIAANAYAQLSRVTEGAGNLEVMRMTI